LWYNFYREGGKAMRVKDVLILRKAKKIFKEKKDKVAVIWYFNKKYPNMAGKDIIALTDRIVGECNG
jgi:hypothetical protein